MSINIRGLKKDKHFENEKILIRFSVGDISKSLEVHLKDENGKRHHIIWEILSDRNRQNFDKANEKIRTFVKNKINEWLNEEEEEERQRNEAIKKEKEKEENKLKNLLDSF